MERAGVDVITDGEMRRESYSNRFATALDGVDLDDARRRARPDRPREPGPAGRRADAAHAAGGDPRRRVPPLDHRPADQDHRPGAVHDDAAGAERPLRRRPQPRARLRGGGQRGAARPQGGRRRPRPDRRAVPAGAARRGARVRGRGDQPRAGRDRAARPSSTPASATPTSSTTGCRGYPFLAELADCSATHISLEAAQPDLDPELLRALPGQDDRARRARPGRGRGRDAERRRGPSPPGARGACRRSGSSPRPTAG